jgi:hypothetical protein
MLILFPIAVNHQSHHHNPPTIKGAVMAYEILASDRLMLVIAGNLEVSITESKFLVLL